MSADTDALAKNKEKLEELNQALSEAKSAYEGIKDAQSVNKSYPTFFNDFKSLGGVFDVI